MTQKPHDLESSRLMFGSTAFRVLEWFAHNPDRPVRLGTLEEEIGAHRGTAVYQRMRLDLIDRKGWDIRHVKTDDGEHVYWMPASCAEVALRVVKRIATEHAMRSAA